MTNNKIYANINSNTKSNNSSKIAQNIAFLSLIFIFASFILLPIKAQAIDFNPFNPLDPFCLFSCDDNDKHDEAVVQNVTNTNSNNTTNTNSNNTTNTSTTVNSPAVVATPIPVVYNTPIVYTPVYTYDNYNSYNYTSPLYVSCYSIPTTANVGSSVEWRASVSGGNGSYYYSWSGTEGLSGYGSSIVKSYNYSGSKTAVVTVISGNQTISQNCGGSVMVYDYNNYNYNYNNNYSYNNYPYNYNYYTPLSVSCSANVTFSPAGQNVIWTAYPTGGNGYYTYGWTGTDNIYGSQSSINTYYNFLGLKYATVTVYSDGRQISAQCTNTVTVGVPTVNYNNQYYPNKYVAPAVTYTGKTYSPKKAVVTVVKETPKETVQPVVEKEDSLSAASLFSLKNVPWGWVIILVLLVLFSVIIYLILNRKKM